MNDLIKALQIFAKVPEVANSKWPTHSGHDVLMVNAEPEDYSEEDLAELERLGFIPCIEYGGFMSYRFGSA